MSEDKFELLKKKREEALAAGGPERIKRQHDKGKYTARERMVRRVPVL